MVADADGARVGGSFFLITRQYDHPRRVETVLTLRAVDVIGAEIEKDGVATEDVRGRGLAKA